MHRVELPVRTSEITYPTYLQRHPPTIQEDQNFGTGRNQSAVVQSQCRKRTYQCVGQGFSQQPRAMARLEQVRAEVR